MEGQVCACAASALDPRERGTCISVNWPSVEIASLMMWFLTLQLTDSITLSHPAFTFASLQHCGVAHTALKFWSLL